MKNLGAIILRYSPTFAALAPFDVAQAMLCGKYSEFHLQPVGDYSFSESWWPRAALCQIIIAQSAYAAQSSQPAQSKATVRE